MTSNYIANPRPMFNEDLFENKKKNVERLIMGGKSSGIVFDINREGIEVNGYYEGFHPETRHANMMEPIMISWEEFDKIRSNVENKKRNVNVPDSIDEVIDKEYLSTLPVVHINGKEYYIDGSRRERRTVGNPEKVYKF